jgi:hypothetical protein
MKHIRNKSLSEKMPKRAAFMYIGPETRAITKLFGTLI